jgi:hypothetical protein
MQLGKAVSAGIAADVTAEVEAVAPVEVPVEATDTGVPETVGSATAR